MKYTVEGLQQNVLIEYGLDGIDAIIIRYIIDFFNTGKMAKVFNDGKEYFWINYKVILEEIPIIGIKNKDVLYRRFKKYIECGLMEHYTKKNGGIYSYYKFDENKLLKLVSNSKPSDSKVGTPSDSKVGTPTQKSEPSDSKVGTPSDSKVGTKDSSTKLNSSSKDNYYNDEYMKVPLTYHEELKKHFHINDKDLEYHYKEMRMWFLVNPKKIKSNTNRFILNWLNKEKEKGTIKVYQYNDL